MPGQVPTVVAVAAAPEPPKRKRHRVRNLFLVVVGVIVVIAIIQSAGGGDDPETPSTTTQQDDAAGGGRPQEAAEDAAGPGLGEPAEDGDFTFVVDAVEEGPEQIGTDTFGTTPQGRRPSVGRAPSAPAGPRRRRHRGRGASGCVRIHAW